MQFIPINTNSTDGADTNIWINVANIIWISEKDGQPRLHMVNGWVLIPNLDTVEGLLAKIEAPNFTESRTEIPDEFFNAWNEDNENEGKQPA